MTAIAHNYNWAAHSTVHWDTSDSLNAYQKNLSNPAFRWQLEQFGYIDATIDYSFNSHGFRTVEFDRQFDCVVFGCSFTMGTGLRQQHTWPAQLEKITALTCANLAHAGSSNDTAFRMASHYLPILRPKYALWLQTDAHRLEILDDPAGISVNLMANDRTNTDYGSDQFVKQWFVSASNQQLNLQKNTRAFRNLCTELDIVCVIVDRSAVVFDDLARDLKHPGILSNLAMARKFASLLGFQGTLAEITS